MQKRRTHHFKLTLLISLGISTVFLLLLAAFGARLCALSFHAVADSIFVFLVTAAASFLIFSFLPYFRGDKRWYSISALLTVVFFCGVAILWQFPVSGGVL